MPQRDPARAERQRPPAAASAPPLTVVVPAPRPSSDDVLSVRLANGLTGLARSHRGAPVVAVQLWLRVGARDETETEWGVSHFLEHLLFKGSPQRPPGSIDRAIAARGGEINAATSQDFTYYHVLLPAPHLGIALDVLADMAMQASMPEEEVERERLVVLEEIRRAHDNPATSLGQLLAQHHFTGHPYARPVLGTATSIGSVPRERVVDYYRRRYVPELATVVVVGDLDAMRALAEIERAFGGWPARAAEPHAAPRAAGPAVVRRADDTRALAHTHLAMAWSGPQAPEPDVYAVDVLSAILGAGRAARLTQALRERQGLVSSIGARWTSQRSAGAVVVTCRANEVAVERLETAILAETEGVRHTLVDDAELGRAKTAVEATRVFREEACEGLAHAYGWAHTVRTLAYETAYLEGIRRVTAPAVREAAYRYLDPGRYTRVALRPEVAAT